MVDITHHRTRKTKRPDVRRLLLTRTSRLMILATGGGQPGHAFAALLEVRSKAKVEIELLAIAGPAQEEESVRDGTARGGATLLLLDRDLAWDLV